MSAPSEVRFWAKVDKPGDQDCWEWLGSKDNDGYGSFWHDGRTMPAHRFSLELAKGLIPEELVVDHLCRNPKCVNPAHLEAVTRRENLLRGSFENCNHNKLKTHCPHGHPYSGENLIISKSTGQRNCRTCEKERNRRYDELRRRGRKGRQKETA